MKILPTFNWWIGIVEDRMDPYNMGRCRVRIFGYHTANKQTLPTADLPWATPMMPVTSASVSGVGSNHVLVEGSTVIGFFADGKDEQQPIIMGSLNGRPEEREEDPNIGFNDPFNIFPRNGEEPGYNELNEPDISRLARGAAAEDHASLVQKRESRLANDTKIPIAKAPEMDSVTSPVNGASYETEFWEEPHPRFGKNETGSYQEPGQLPTFEDSTTSVYPYNNVTETESGHVFEVDDTPNNGRIHEYHNSGTFYEVQADGTKVTKIVGDDYKIVIQNQNIFVQGNCNLTVEKDLRLRVGGDYYEEIKGNKFTTIGDEETAGSRHTKIQGNDCLEVGTGSNTNITGDSGLRVGGQANTTVMKANVLSVGGNYSATVGRKISLSAITDISLNSVLGNMNLTTGIGNITATAIGAFKASGTTMSLTAVTNQTIAAGINQLVEAGAIQNLAAVTQNTTAVTQNTTAPTRVISGITTHTGAYNVAGPMTSTVSVTAPAISGTVTVTGGAVSGSVVSQGSIILGTHKHTGVTSGGALTGTPSVI